MRHELACGWHRVTTRRLAFTAAGRRGFPMKLLSRNLMGGPYSLSGRGRIILRRRTCM